MTQSLSKVVVCFDLDDTLYKEHDYLLSGFKAIARDICSKLAGDQDPDSVVRMLYDAHIAGQDAFSQAQASFGVISKDELQSIYRAHSPSIHLSEGASFLLDSLKDSGCTLGLITDGRQLSQNNKIDALGLRKWFGKDDIVISETFGSEKPDERNYRYFEDRYPGCRYYYVGDNIEKDFVAPNHLGWTTICVKDNDNRNIHSTSTQNLERSHMARFEVSGLHKILELITFARYL